MPEWVRDSRELRLRVPGASQDTRFDVAGVMDRTDAERPKLVLQERADNRGPSLESEPVRAFVIETLANEMDIDPATTDWFVMGKGQELRSVEVSSTTEVIEDPRFSELKRRNDEPDIESARRFFPDVERERTTAELRDVPPREATELEATFERAEDLRPQSPEIERSQEPSVRDYDLTQYDFPR